MKCTRRSEAMRYLICGLALVDASAMTVCAQPPAAWVTIKGQVVLPEGVAIPKRAPLMVGGPNGPACLACAKGAIILNETIIVNAKNRGIKNAVVWLRPDNKDAKATFAANEIHPAEAKRKPKDV